MDFRNISAWAIRNPVPPLVLFAALLLLGLFSFMRMPVNDTPDIDFPAASVTIVQPGAAPTELETQVTQKVEAAIRGVTGIDEISSTVREGSSSTFVQFAIGTPTDRAVNDVRDAIANIRSDLPDGILEPQVARVDVSGDAIAYFAAESTDMTLEELSWYVDNVVSKRLQSISGVAAVSRGGGVDREIRVILDPGKLQAQGVTATQVNAQLRALNLNAAGGRAEIAGSEQSVRVLGNARNAFQLSQSDIALPGGRTVKLADIAEVRDSFAEQRRLAKMNGRQVLSFGITRSKGASEVAIYDATLKELDKLKKENPKVSFPVLFTSVPYTLDQYNSSISAMWEGAVLAIIVVFLFLRDWRATIISAIAIPLSAIPAFWFMDLLGFSLNFLSLLALSLVAGVLVDDAIVEIENIVRHMRMGKSAYQASIDAADEIGLAVLATTMAIVAVFLPVGLMPGVSGQFFKNFGLTVVAAVLVSLAVARLITPMVAAYFLKSHGTASHGEGRLMDRYMAVLHWTLDTTRARQMCASINRVPSRLGYAVPTLVVPVLLALAAGYAAHKGLGRVWPTLPASVTTIPLARALLTLLAVIAAIPLGLAVVRGLLLAAAGLGLVSPSFAAAYPRWRNNLGRRIYARMFDHRLWVMSIGVAALVATVFIGRTMPQTFSPANNSDYSTVRIEMTPGTTLKQTETVADRVREELARAPEVDKAFSSIAVASANIYLSLKKDREISRTEFERKWSPRLNDIPDGRVNFQSQSGGGPGGAGRDITIHLGGSDPIALTEQANKLVEQMATLPQLRAPRVSGDLLRPEIVIKPRLELAASLGVTTAALSQTIRIATLGDIDQNTAKFSLNDRQIPIRTMLGEESRRSIATIENLPVPTANGGSVPLKVVADIGFGAGPTAIQRTNQIRRISVGADLAPGLVSGDAMPSIEALPVLKNLPVGITKLELGDTKWQAELILNFVLAVLAGVLLVFAVLVLLYKRLMPPLVNMGSLLLAPLGGVIALKLTGNPFSMPVYIGILMLLGIVAKNSILLVDFALEEMRKGVSLVDAVVDAGHKRAQPIVMTTVAMVAGMVPVSLSLGSDGSFRAPMGITVIGGLLLSTVLTLVIVPAAFTLAVGFENRVGPWLKRKLTNGGEDALAASPQPAE